MIVGFHQTYGVGMPITIRFSSPVTHRAAVENAIQLTTSKPVVGTWNWDSNESQSLPPRDVLAGTHQREFHGAPNGLETPPACTARPT